MAASILIVKLSSLGDVVHTLPAAQALRAAFPQARLGWAVERAHATVLRGQPWLDERIEWDRRSLGTFADFIRRVRRGRWELAIDFQGLARSGLVTWLSGARRRLGFRQAGEGAAWCYNAWVDRPTLDRHAVERSLDLVRELGATLPGLPLARPYLGTGASADAPVSIAAPRDSSTAAPVGPQLFPLHPEHGDLAAVTAWLARHRVDPDRDRLVLLHPHCRKEANRWPASRFVELAGRLLERPNTRVGLIGGPSTRELCNEIAAPWGDRVLRADGAFSLLGTAELLARSSVLVTGDTGPMHLAAAMGTPIVALFGPANPVRTGPYAVDAIVLWKRLACAPCYARECPLGHNPPACMDQITVDEALSAVERQLARAAAARPARRTAG